MKDRRDNKHQQIKDRKWYGGGHKQGNRPQNSFEICECGKQITSQEADRYDGMCKDCYDIIVGR